MKLNEFTESVVSLLNNGVYYTEKTSFEVPYQIKQISDKAVMVEFLKPEDTFMITIERRHDQDDL